jgi:hypothetical protein
VPLVPDLVEVHAEDVLSVALRVLGRPAEVELADDKRCSPSTTRVYYVVPLDGLLEYELDQLELVHVVNEVPELSVVSLLPNEGTPSVHLLVRQNARI